MEGRALLISNPNASGTTPRIRDVIAHALGAVLKIEVAETERRHHATELAAAAAAEGYGTVVSLGGDGTLNEVVNGIAHTQVALVPLPGGRTNVFARTHGLPRDPVEATSVILQHLESGGPARTLDLARINGRAFAFCAGIGFDADLVRAVESHPRWKRRFGETFFFIEGVQRFFGPYPRRQAPMTLIADVTTLEGVRQVFACTSDPFTFWGRRRLRLCPGARPGGGLSVTALTSLSTFTSLRTLLRAFGSARQGKLSRVHVLDHLDGAAVHAARAMPYQVDGDFAGEATTFTFEMAPGALRLLVP